MRHFRRAPPHIGMDPQTQPEVCDEAARVSTLPEDVALSAYFANYCEVSLLCTTVKDCRVEVGTLKAQNVALRADAAHQASEAARLAAEAAFLLAELGRMGAENAALKEELGRRAAGAPEEERPKKRRRSDCEYTDALSDALRDKVSGDLRRAVYTVFRYKFTEFRRKQLVEGGFVFVARIRDGVRISTAAVIRALNSQARDRVVMAYFTEGKDAAVVLMGQAAKYPGRGSVLEILRPIAGDLLLDGSVHAVL